MNSMDLLVADFSMPSACERLNAVFDTNARPCPTIFKVAAWKVAHYNMRRFFSERRSFSLLHDDSIVLKYT